MKKHRIIFKKIPRDITNWVKGRVTAGTLVHLPEREEFGKYLLFFHGSGPKSEGEGDFDKNASIGMPGAMIYSIGIGPERITSRANRSGPKAVEAKAIVQRTFEPFHPLENGSTMPNSVEEKQDESRYIGADL
ncbi:hypothetical protein [Cyclobacterium xiamenense]|uniref:hypothetical protein n=1 Tax=Cyclobacterium xiamenense TaxID=1297121 RepID=UPI0019D67202|nr:hypothetical protein [Cyclobacterium xiamenense]